MNWSELLTKANQTLFNAGQVVRNLWKLHFDPTPRDLQVSFYDEYGELKTVKIPNRAKILADFEAWREGARSEFPLFPLHVNPSFIKDNGDGTYSVYGLYSVYTYGKPSVSISVVDDDTLPLDLDYSDGIQKPAKVVEITIDNSAGSSEALKDYSVAPSSNYASPILDYTNVRKKRIYMELMVKKVSGNGVCILQPHFLKYGGMGKWYSGKTVKSLDTTEWQHLTAITYPLNARGFPRPWFRFKVPPGEKATFRITRGYAYLLGIVETKVETIGGE